MSCGLFQPKNEPILKKVSNKELKEMMSLLEVTTVKLVDIHASRKAYLFTVEDSITNHKFLLTGARTSFFKDHDIRIPSYYNKADSLYLGCYFKAITSSGEYKVDEKNSSIYYIVLRILSKAS